MAPDIRLIATDLDGTLIGGANDFPLYNDFRERINELRLGNQAIWAACTGRSSASFRQFFAPMRLMGLMPEYIVIRHAFIFRLTRFGYAPNVLWNLFIRYRLWANRLYSREAMRQWHELLTGTAMGVKTVRTTRDRLYLRFESEESASVAAKLLADRLSPNAHLRVFRYRSELDVRHVPFTKGLAVSELARHLGVGPERVLAIGNGHNDISMLDGQVARHTGCPANSEAEVIEVVSRAGGHIARSRSLRGVMEVLDAVFGDAVDSTLPEDWTAPSEGSNPLATRESDRHDHHTSGERRGGGWILALVLYAVLMVFASFGLLPFSDSLMRPYRWMFSVMEDLLSRFW